MATLETADRVHLKATQGAKGTWQLEVSVEAKDNESAKALFDQGFTDAVEVMAKHNLPIAGSTVETK